MKLHDRYSLRYFTKFKYNLKLPQGGIPATMLKYLELNIKNNWGWYHEDKTGVISFENEKDYILVSLMLDKWDFQNATNTRNRY